MAVQVMLVYFIPVIGPTVSFFFMSWLYALYCFEYVNRVSRLSNTGKIIILFHR